jgi:peptidyl-dipeptidase A
MLARPAGREVVCHASAYDLGHDRSVGNEDVRIKMCTMIRMEDLLVSTHELGHIHYFLAYANQSFLFRQGANDGFHEAIGDTIRLSVTPKALRDAGLLPSSNTTDSNTDSLSYEALINSQLSVALEKIVIMPFAYLVDKWRWGVFKGTVPESAWNRAWWTLK